MEFHSDFYASVESDSRTSRCNVFRWTVWSALFAVAPFHSMDPPSSHASKLDRQPVAFFDWCFRCLKLCRMDDRRRQHGCPLASPLSLSHNYGACHSHSTGLGFSQAVRHL